MQLTLNKNGKRYRGITTQISAIDRDLGKFRWTVINVDSTGKRARLYVQHRATKKSAVYFGVPVGYNIYLHRLILARKLQMPYVVIVASGVRCDHKNGTGLDNSRSNIRPATSNQNNQNRRTGPYKGVYRTKFGTFWSGVQADGVFHYCGTFHSREEAKEARDEMAKKLHARFFHS